MGLTAIWALLRSVPLLVYPLVLASGLAMYRGHEVHVLQLHEKEVAVAAAAEVVEQKHAALVLEDSWRVKLEAQRHENEIAIADVTVARDAALAGLRDRPAVRRIFVPSPTGTISTGATGPELARPDAEFLARYAAVARRFQLELGACQAREAVIGGK